MKNCRCLLDKKTSPNERGCKKLGLRSVYRYKLRSSTDCGNLWGGGFGGRFVLGNFRGGGGGGGTIFVQQLRQRPIDDSAIDERWELSGSRPHCIPDRAEAQGHVKVLADAANEEAPQ
eukprot:3877587-Amphidinium_carterae.1